MSIASITDTLWIDNPEAYERFLRLQEEPVEQQEVPGNDRIEEGEQLLKLFLSRLKD